MRYVLRRVEFMPKELEPGVLYFAEEYGAAAHLCACGCGTKIRTPILPTEWSITESEVGVSLFPSVGNWQQPCRSHYFITDGRVDWKGSWSDAKVRHGRQREVERRALYFADRAQMRKPNVFVRIWRWLRK